MASLREIRRKIKSVKSTQQITKAMKMVAAARLRRAQSRILSARPFADKMEELVVDLCRRAEGVPPHPLFVSREGNRRALLLVTSDKGLCGAFNTNLIREGVKYLRLHTSANVDFYVVGRKGKDYFRRLGVSIVKDYTGILGNVEFAQADLIAQELMGRYQSHPIVAVDLLYNEFKSIIQQRPVIKPLLPLSLIGQPASEIQSPPWPDFIYEPAQKDLMAALVPRFIKAQVFRVLLESAAGELGARMTAMGNATRNASDLLDSLTLTLNRSRQASITKEILEIVSGAEALT